MNSKLIDWYFRLGSTNSKVNEYQFNNLPCPIFRDKPDKQDDALIAPIHKLLDTDVAAIPDALESGLVKGPFSLATREAMEQLARKIQTAEQERSGARYRTADA